MHTIFLCKHNNLHDIVYAFVRKYAIKRFFREGKLAGMDVDIEKELKERWDDLTSWMTEETKIAWWEKLKTAYSEPERKYHNLCHLHQIFQHYDQHKDYLENRYAFAYAIFFHE